MIGRSLASFLSLLLWAVALAACGRDGSAASFETPLDAPIQLAPGQSAVFAAEKLEVQFTGIASDSRCPNDVTCVWAGEVLVQLAIRSKGQATQHEIKETQSVAIDNYTVTVLQVLPARASSHPIAPADYRVTLKVAH
jgi:hypothetical protein